MQTAELETVEAAPETTPRERWEASGYYVQYSQEEIATIKGNVAEADSKIRQTNQTIVNLRGKLGAAKRLLALAEAALAIPIEHGQCVPGDAHAAPLQDKRRAESAIQRLTAQFAEAEQYLVAQRSALELWKDKQKDINQAALLVASELAELRRQIMA